MPQQLFYHLHLCLSWIKCPPFLFLLCVPLRAIIYCCIQWQWIYRQVETFVTSIYWVPILWLVTELFQLHSFTKIKNLIVFSLQKNLFSFSLQRHSFELFLFSYFELPLSFFLYNIWQCAKQARVLEAWSWCGCLGLWGWWLWNGWKASRIQLWQTSCNMGGEEVSTTDLCWLVLLLSMELLLKELVYASLCIMLHSFFFPWFQCPFFPSNLLDQINGVIIIHQYLFCSYGVSCFEGMLFVPHKIIYACWILIYDIEPPPYTPWNNHEEWRNIFPNSKTKLLVTFPDFCWDLGIWYNDI